MKWLQFSRINVGDNSSIAQIAVDGLFGNNFNSKGNFERDLIGSRKMLTIHVT